MLADAGEAVGREQEAADVESDLRERVATLQTEVATADLAPTG